MPLDQSHYINIIATEAGDISIITTDREKKVYSFHQEHNDLTINAQKYLM